MSGTGFPWDFHAWLVPRWAGSHASCARSEVMHQRAHMLTHVPAWAARAWATNPPLCARTRLKRNADSTGPKRTANHYMRRFHRFPLYVRTVRRSHDLKSLNLMALERLRDAVEALDTIHDRDVLAMRIVGVLQVRSDAAPCAAEPEPCAWRMSKAPPLCLLHQRQTCACLLI